MTHDPHNDPHGTPHDDPDTHTTLGQQGVYPHLSLAPNDSRSHGTQKPVPGRNNETSHSASSTFSTQNGTAPSAPTQTQQELDALADLFLGPLGCNGDEDAGAHDSPCADTEKNEPDLAAAHDTRNATMQPHRVPVSVTHLPAKTAPQPAACPIEGVLLGHLPVYAAAWPMQYARVLSASKNTPVIVVRIAGETLHIDLVGSCHDSEWTACQEACEEDSIECILAHARAISGHCLIRVDEVDECCLWEVQGLDSLALLTGSNDAAVVACYRSLKTLAMHSQQNEQLLPGLHLVVMGSNQTQSEQIHERIARAADAFLETNLGDPTIIERIAPAQSRRLYHGPHSLSLAAIVEFLTHAPAPATPDPAHSHTHVEPIEHVESTSVQAAPCATDAFSSQSHSAAAPAATNTHLLTRLCSPLVPLESQCPFEPLVELATDAQGTLHLLAASLEKRPELSCTHAVQSLLIVRHWSQQHASLLVRAEPQLGMLNSNNRREPAALSMELHLLTDSTREARTLAETPLLVHLVVSQTPQQSALHEPSAGSATPNTPNTPTSTQGMIAIPMT